jgi:hypothetical protein
VRARRAALQAEAADLSAAVVATLLARVDLRLPAWALRCGDLLPVDTAAALAEAVERAAAGGLAEHALRATIQAAGPDALRLLGPGMLAADDPRIRALAERLGVTGIGETP